MSYQPYYYGNYQVPQLRQKSLTHNKSKPNSFKSIIKQDSTFNNQSIKYFYKSIPQLRQENTCDLRGYNTIETKKWSSELSVAANTNHKENKNKFHEGVLLFSNGKYQGQLYDNRAYGKGLFYYENGDKHFGMYIDNKKNGRGIYYFSDGRKLLSTWIDDRLNDIGKVYKADGRIFIAKWQDGNLIDGFKINENDSDDQCLSDDDFSFFELNHVKKFN